MSKGQRGVVAAVDDGAGPLAQRLLELGLTDGEEVEVVRFALLGDPMEVRVRGYSLTLRRSEAQAVLVEPAP